MANKENVQKLVDALRSDRFTQGQGQLHEIRSDGTERYCCLGVACVVAMENGIELKTAELEAGLNPVIIDMTYDGERYDLPSTVSEFYGFSGFDYDNPYLHSPDLGRRQRATELNDDYDLTLAQIADAFECTYLRAESPENED